jgi:16S rRNA processing protein RimM
LSDSPQPVAQIVGSFGIRGELKIDPLTDFHARFAKGSRLRLKGNWLTVEAIREHRGRPLMKLEGVNDKTAADALQWEYLEAIVTERPVLEEDEFFVEDLIGLRVVSEDGRELGKIDDIVPNPAHDILQVGAVLIPVVKEFVKEIDLEAGVVTVHLIPGLADDL